MAKQEGILPVKGSIDNITFYKSKDGFLMRKRGGPSAEKIAGDPAFQRTRENNAEFGRAGIASRLLRTACRAALAQASDSRMNSRLTALMVKAVKSDTISVRGERNINNGNLSLLNGFDFNGNGKLATSFYAPFATGFDRPSGEATVSAVPFIPQNMVAAPAGATHFQLVGSGAAINFGAESYISAITEGPILPMDNNLTAPIQLTIQLGAAGTDPVFLLFGIRFYQEINGQNYLLKNGSFNALAVADVNIL